MRASPAAPSWLPPTVEEDRREGLKRTRAVLSHEGFTVSPGVGEAPGRGARSPDLVAANGPRVVRVFVLVDREIDSPETCGRVREALRKGETWLSVPWPLRWRALSNLDRWGLRGASVTGW
jgi:hypothetical protein